MFLRNNSIINFDLNLCNKLIPCLDNKMKFPPILEIRMGGKGNLEYYIFTILIQSSISLMKSLSLNVDMNSISPEQCKKLIKFIEFSKIEFLELGARDYDTIKFLEFCDYIKNSVNLKIFKLKEIYLDTNLNNAFFESLKFNQSIQILIFIKCEFSMFPTNLRNLIMFNTSITSLVISGSHDIIDEGFIKGVLKSKSLKYLFLYLYCKQKDETVLKLSESNLKGIYIAKHVISQETMNQIYCKIPRIDYSEEMQYYEKFLK